jgi:nucleotidyltransferase/DNA polymerase involved in DNA repair
MKRLVDGYSWIEAGTTPDAGVTCNSVATAPSLSDFMLERVTVFRNQAQRLSRLFSLDAIRLTTDSSLAACRRIARTVVLKLKTSEFNVLTRSYTPASPPSSCEELTNIALSLRERVDMGPLQRFRLVGVGLSNFREPEGKEDTSPQPVLFE